MDVCGLRKPWATHFFLDQELIICYIISYWSIFDTFTNEKTTPYKIGQGEVI